MSLSVPVCQPGFFIFDKTRFMKYCRLLSVLIFLPFSITAQTSDFPGKWIGNWKGELQWFKTGKPEPQKVNMELRIQPGDSSGNYTWHLIYGSAAEDSRPYILKVKDSAAGHWVIDELNGIVLDQFWVGGRFCGAFTVQNSTIISNYWTDGDNLLVEFFSAGAKPLVTTGKGTDDSPKVDSYKIGSYQKAVLKRK